MMAGVTKILLSLLLLYCSSAVSQKVCPKGRVGCSSEDKCVSINYDLCDGSRDCDDGEDEDHSMCTILKDQGTCNRGKTACYRLGERTCIDIETYCNHEFEHCEGDLDLRICQMLKDGQLQDLDDVVVRDFVYEDNLSKSERLGRQFHLVINDTLSHPNCPAMYTQVGDQCLSIFFVGSVSWGEARSFCQAINGDLATFRNLTHFRAVTNHLKDARVTTDFWIGGRYVDETETWTWLTEKPIELGTPYWAVKHEDECARRNVTFPELNTTRAANDGACYHYVQAPGANIYGRCVSLPYEHFYYMNDDSCLVRKSPLCLYTGKKYEPLAELESDGSQAILLQ